MEMKVAKVIHQKDLTLDNLVLRVEEVIESRIMRQVLDEINEKEHLEDGLNRTIEALVEVLE
jgi:hypothetical protein